MALLASAGEGRSKRAAAGSPLAKKSRLLVNIAIKEPEVQCNLYASSLLRIVEKGWHLGRLMNMKPSSLAQSYLTIFKRKIKMSVLQNVYTVGEILWSSGQELGNWCGEA